MRGFGNRTREREEGQASVEIVLTVLFYLGVILVFVELVWYWWGHLMVAAALNDGVAAIGRAGSVDAGLEEMRRLVYAALDRRHAALIMQNVEFRIDRVQRLVYGRVDVRWPPLLFPLPAPMWPPIRAASVQRLEGFYPGQPPSWPWE